MNKADEIEKLKSEFLKCQKLLTAFDDKVRQNLVMLMIAENGTSIRAAELAEKTNLSRPAISHHMQILKAAGIVKCEKKGKFMFYSLNSDGDNLDLLAELFQKVKHQIRKSTS